MLRVYEGGMSLSIFRIVVRNRHVRTMVFLIILFTSMVIPFYTLSGHFRVVEKTVSKYISAENIYLVLGIKDSFTVPHNYKYVYLHMDEAILYIGGRDINIFVFSFSNYSLAGELLNIDMSKLGGDSCIVASYIADKYGLEVGDSITLVVDGGRAIYRVAGFDRYFPIIIPYNGSSTPDGMIIRLPKSSPSYPPDLYKSVRVYRLGSYFGLIDELRMESLKILSLWSIPLYFVVVIGVAIVSSRLLYSIRYDLDILHTLGFSNRYISLLIIISLLPILFCASFVGVSLGIVLSQVSAKLAYIVLGGITIYPVLRPSIYISILAVIFLSALAGVLSTFLWSGMWHGEAD